MVKGRICAHCSTAMALIACSMKQIRADLRTGRIGLAQNRLPVSSKIEDVWPGDVFDATAGLPAISP